MAKLGLILKTQFSYLNVSEFNMLSGKKNVSGDVIKKFAIFYQIREGKYIFVYGGDDIEWIRRFTTAARSVAQAALIPLEMVYVGKSNKKEQVRRVINTITQENLSYTWQDLMVWFFWTRLKSMLFSKIQLGKADDNDPMMQVPEAMN